MSKKIRTVVLACMLAAACGMTGCESVRMPENSQVQKQTSLTQYKATFLDLFDTVTTIVGYAENEEAFQEQIQPMKELLQEYHQLFDIYHTYEGITNLKTINDHAGMEPVAADERIIQLLLDCREFYDVTDGKVNAAMGSVLGLWHDARTDGVNDPVHAKLPDEDALRAAAEHMDFDSVIIDEEASTIQITDPKMRLDVGAVAKGWTAQRVAEQSPEGMLISLGGNVCATGPKPETGAAWVVGIQDPDGEADKYLHTIYVNYESVVTSGDYQRVYVVDGKEYHHIIDPDTLYPSEYWQAVSIVCKDSGIADMLSTALFQLPIEEGQKLLDQYDAQAVWVGIDGTISYSPGFKDLIRT